MANAGYGVTCHDFKAMFSEPVYRVPRVVNGQASQRRISCVFVNPHTVSEVCVEAGKPVVVSGRLYRWLDPIFQSVWTRRLLRIKARPE